MRASRRIVSIAFIAALVAMPVAFAQPFANFESPHAHPLDMTPDETLLLAVNTPDARLEVFTLAGPTPVHLASVPVGLEPVSVRVRSADEAWVVNHLSDTVSVVDLNTFRVTRTIPVSDEPSDVVFAGSPERAFLSSSQANTVEVHDPASPLAPPTFITIDGEDPRVLATDGSRVYAAVFQSGNNSTILSQTVVSSAINPYAGDQNPPPNDGAAFAPAMNPANPTPPEVGLIVKKDAQGVWRDDNGADWSAAVGWDLHDHDVAIIDADTLGVTYADGLMNHNMALGVRPDGTVGVVGTDALNHIRFEPNLNGVFLRVLGATFDPANTGAAPSIVDLNPHLDYTTSTVAQSIRDQSIGDPRAVVFDSTGRAFVAGMGSNNIAVFDASMSRTGRVEVGEGPTGLVLRESASHLYALNRFEGSVSVVSTSAMTEVARVVFYDPTPQELREGRRFLFDTHLTSGLGNTSCASCHTDGAMDNLSWDLGDPAGDMKIFNQVCNGGLGGCEDWHPMKGPMTTQTLIGIIGTEPFHWRADREDLGAFNPAFASILGDDTLLTTEEMALFEQYIASRRFGPNPFRNLDNSLPATFANGGDPAAGEVLYLNAPIDGGFLTCVSCHALPTGTNQQLTSANALQETQSIKVPQLRNMFEKTGFSQVSQANNRGFGYIKDGSVDNLFNFLQFPGFNFSSGATGDQERRDIEAFLLSFDTGTHAAVGEQVFVTSQSNATIDELTTLDDLVALADANAIGLVAHQPRDGVTRSYTYTSPVFQADQTGEIYTRDALLALAQPGEEILFTAVVKGSETRLGVDRDLDGYMNYDELVACSDPADPGSTPENAVSADFNADGQVDGADLGLLLGAWGTADTDLNGDGTTDGADLGLLLGAWGACS